MAALPHETEAPERAGTQRLPRSERLQKRSQFLRVQTQGRRVHTPHFIVLLLSGGARRLGVTVGKRVGKATERNRVKRLVREVFRRNKALFPADCDVVLVARPGAERLDYGAVKGRGRACSGRPAARWPRRTARTPA